MCLWRFRYLGQCRPSAPLTCSCDTQHLVLDPCRESRSVLSQRARREHLCDEIHRIRLLIQPRIIERHDILVLQLLQHTNFCKQPVPAAYSSDALHDRHMRSYGMYVK